MATATHEQTINTAFAEVVEGVGRGWSIRAENVGGVFEGGGRPDALIEKEDGWPIVIEAEVGNHHQAEVEAISRLNRTVASTGREVHASVALVYPQALRNFQGRALRMALGEAQFEYALYAAEKDGSASRFPDAGWISGDIAELSLLLHRSSMPAWRVDALADSLERGVVRASGRFTASHGQGSALGMELRRDPGAIRRRRRPNPPHGDDGDSRRVGLPRGAVEGGDASSGNAEANGTRPNAVPRTRHISSVANTGRVGPHSACQLLGLSSNECG